MSKISTLDPGKNPSINTLSAWDQAPSPSNTPSAGSNQPPSSAVALASATPTPAILKPTNGPPPLPLQPQLSSSTSSIDSKRPMETYRVIRPPPQDQSPSPSPMIRSNSSDGRPRDPGARNQRRPGGSNNGLPTVRAPKGPRMQNRNSSGVFPNANQPPLVQKDLVGVSESAGSIVTSSGQNFPVPTGKIEAKPNIKQELYLNSVFYKPQAYPTPTQPDAPAPIAAAQQPEKSDATLAPAPAPRQQTTLPRKGHVDPLLPEAPLQELYESLSLEQLMEQNLPPDLTGEIVADYQEMAHGGFAYVVKGTWGKADIQVAIKVLKARKNRSNPQAWETSLERRLNRELNVWAALNHPNIAEFLGCAEGFGDFPAMISKWCHLGTAADYLSRGVINPETRYHLSQDVADGLGYLHGLKIIHGDLKPTNILIDDQHNARLCDFGLVRLDDWEGPAGMTTTSPYTGTERYKAPELFASVNNRHPVATTQGDIYALACIILEFIELTLPYQQFIESFDLMEAIIKHDIPPAIRPEHAKNSGNFDEYFWDLLEACWSHIPVNRPRAVEVIDILVDLPSLASSAVSDEEIVPHSSDS